MTSTSPKLVADSDRVSAGYFSLSWESDDPGDFLLEESVDSAFTQPRRIYHGPDTATLVSGRPNGTYYYRVRRDRDQNQPSWSEVSIVQVEHHPLSRAFSFFVLGALVFFATLFIILKGNKRYT